MKNRLFIYSLLMTLSLVNISAYSIENSNLNDSTLAKYNVAKWNESDKIFYEKWLNRTVSDSKTNDKKLLLVVQEFKELIENDAKLYMLFTQMFEQIPKSEKFKKDPTGNLQIKDYHQMLAVMNKILTTAPEFNKTGLIGFPLNAILNWPMGTPAGTQAFLDVRVNAQLKKILNQWAVFLRSSESSYVLNENPKNGWFGKDAKKAMPNFEKDFICDPKAPHYGFKSWDDYFTRKFIEKSRPVSSPDDDSVIANACESAPYKIAKNVKYSDTFWIKSQPYSLKHMMDNDPLTKKFDGGTIYQAFLSATSYHRWHSPVSGTIVKTKLIGGSYYGASLTQGLDKASPNDSQGYITQVASRGLIFIEADNKDIGLMAILFIGMAEVSSNEITVFEGQHVKKGEQLGMFHYGGSTHCLIFRAEVDIEFDLRDQKPGLKSKNILVRSKIAQVN